jgi:hypothetical protein
MLNNNQIKAYDVLLVKETGDLLHVTDKLYHI